MTEPVLQGIAVLGFTEFVISPGPPPSLPRRDGERTAESLPDSDAESMSEDELSIDESFLARSTSTPMLSGLKANGMADGTTTGPEGQKTFQISALTLNREGEADLNDLYVRTQDLTKIGTFSGDWVGEPVQRKRKV